MPRTLKQLDSHLSSTPRPLGWSWGYTSVYYLLNHFTLFLGRFRLFGHLLHTLMIGIPVGSTLAKFNLGAPLHLIEERLLNEWIPDSAPSDMAFDTPATHLMYYNTLKLHMMRHINLDQVTNLQSLYC
ncbi:hypothetical protein DSO57_1017166 [Entomophthora muscae]|uniref:Uncharacterized protein n=1 Tax=Entomophthora muscae TaxID=34485 RepID=A0ACC2RW29_9FUNG|nr:hypothetical protein DSO57_1017166 [Entomophthora muscae]